MGGIYIILLLLGCYFFVKAFNAHAAKDRRWVKKIMAGLGCFLLIFAIEGFTSESPQKAAPTYTLEQQQTAYRNWSVEIDSKVKFFNGTEQTWESIFDQLTAKEISSRTAYGKLKDLKELLANNSRSFHEVKSPQELNDTHQKILSDAANKMSTAASCRADAAEHAMAWLDDPTPSKQKRVLEDLQMGQRFSIQATLLISQVREELKVPAPETTAQK